MSNQYQRIFALEKNLYATGSPVLIEAGAILKDTYANRVLAQLKFTNLSSKTILVLKVSLTPLDTAGRTLGDAIEYQYLDVNAATGYCFGTQNPIYLTNVATRSFVVAVQEVIFADGSIWSGENATWETMPIPKPIDLGNKQLEYQYVLKFGQNCVYAPQKEKDAWICSCGTVNKGEICYRCGNAFESLYHLDLEALKNELEARLALEKQQAEQIEKNKEELLQKKEKAKKKRKIGLSIVAAFLSLAIGFYFVYMNVIVPGGYYNEAIDCMEKGEYETAISIFEDLNGYSDSEEKIEECGVKLYGEKAWSYLRDMQLCDAYYFGNYEQDNQTSNGKESIEWNVLSIDGSNVLLLSTYALDCQPYHNNPEWVTWENCSLRQWLNHDFMNQAFTTDQQKAIQVSTLTSEFGNPTEDRVFILSDEEYYYFNYSEYYDDGTLKYDTYSLKPVYPTDYTYLKNCIWCSGSQDGTFHTYTWSRSHAEQGENSWADIQDCGCEGYFEAGTTETNVGVRPAIWVDLNEVIMEKVK